MSRESETGALLEEDRNTAENTDPKDGAAAGERPKFGPMKTVVGLGLVALFAQLGWMALNFSALPMWMQYKLDMGATLGWVMGAFMLTEAIFRPSLGALGDRIGRRPLMLAGPAIGIFTSVATIFVPRHYMAVPIMILLRAIDGVGLAAFWPAAFAAFGDAVHEDYRSTAMAILNGTQMGAVALGMLLAGVANEWLAAAFPKLFPPYTGAFYFCSLVFILTVVAGFLLLPKREQEHHHAHPPEETHLPHTQELEGAFKMVPDMIILSVVMFAAIGIMMPIVKLYAIDALNMTETQFGSVVFPVAIVLGALALPFGYLADKWGKMISVCYGILVCAGAMWLIAAVRSIYALAGASVLLGIGFEIAFPAWMAIVSQAAPAERRGQVMGAVGLAQGVGALIGVLIAPIIYTRDWLSLPRLGVNHITLPFYLCAILLSIGTVMTFTWISKRRAEQAGGRQITEVERKSVVAASIIFFMLISGWVVYRYTAPIPPDRVAWLWVQQTARHKMQKAEKYTLPAFERSQNGETASDAAAEEHNEWINADKAKYRVSAVTLSSDERKATVTVVFNFPAPNERTLQEVIVLDKQPDGEWKVSGRYKQK